MGFHPKMFSTIHGFSLLQDNQALMLEDMAVDHWDVACAANAGGHYVSLHPRVVVVMDGGRLGVADKRDAAVQPYAAFFVPAGTELWSQVQQPSRLRHVDIHMSQRRLSRLIGDRVLPHKPIYLDELYGIAPLIDLLADTSRDPIYREKLAECVVLEVLHCGQQAIGGSGDQDWLKALEQFVEVNLSRRVDVQELAETAGLSRTQFNRIMRERTGLSPYQWMLNTRIEHAKNLLKTGNAFAEVADMTGFSDQAHFNRVFKSVTGHVPSLWINEH